MESIQKPDLATTIKGDLDFNEQFAQAYDQLENSNENIFVTGKAGTGKSTLLHYFREHTSKNIAVLAPTGVAALNVKGQTLHSFFRFKPDITPDTVITIPIRRAQKKIYQKLDAVVIDEVSMVRADMIDCVDAFLRLYGPKKDKPFGGVQMIFFGDLFQLPPVVTRHEQNLFKDVYSSPYFFAAKSFPTLNLKILELKKIYRQKEQEFIKLLSTIRTKTVSQQNIMDLNKRFNPRFSPNIEDFYIFLTTTNAQAERINQEQLKEIKDDSFYNEGDVLGDFDMKSLPTQANLELKVGAQVMLLNNDSKGRWINGSIGRITYLNTEGYGTDAIEVELTDGKTVEVLPFTWEMFRFYFNEDTETIESEEVGAFTQYPIKLAWAVTIHKSQGKTFDKVVVDIGNGTFSHGQVYVALSRCTSFQGLVLKRPIQKRHILLDERIVDFMENYQPNSL